MTTLSSSNAIVSWTQRTLVALSVVAVLGLPTIYPSTENEALAEDAKKSAEKEPAIEFLPQPTPSEEGILAALEEPTEMDAIETPLAELVFQFGKRHKIQIQLDNRALAESEIGFDVPITRLVNDVKLRSALDLLLRDLDLAYIVKNEVLLVTTRKAAAKELITRTYPVGDLVEEQGGETLIDAITSTILPTSWQELYGPGSIIYVPSAKSLVISNSSQAQDEVLELLRSLRAARKAE